MTDHQFWSIDPGSRCVCGHPEHATRCACGCRRYLCAGSHRDQSRGGAVPAVLALVAFAVLLGVLVTVLVAAAWGEIASCCLH